MRIDQVLAHAGYGTRKQVRQLIKRRYVKVNGDVVTNHGLHVDPNTDVITVHDDEVTYQKYVYLMLNKPSGYITATHDRKHLTVLDLVPNQYVHYCLSPVGRLDKDTEGLLLITNDGKINHMLTSPKRNIWKTYEAVVSGVVTEKHVEQFRHGITLDDGYKTKPARLTIINIEGNRSLVNIMLTEGKYHQVKRMFQATDMEVLYLKRTKIGDIQLDDQLDPGQIRPLTAEEIAWLESLKEGE